MLVSVCGSNVAVEAVDDLVRELELGRLHLGRTDRLGDLGVGVDVLGEVQRLEHERVSAARARGRATRGPSARSGRGRRCPSRASPRAGAGRAGAARPSRPGRGSSCDRARSSRSPRRARSGRSRSTASRRGPRASRAPPPRRSRTGPWTPPSPSRSRPGASSRSCLGHQRFCLIGVRHSRWSSLNETSDWRAAGFVAGARPTGMLTSPKVSDPFQVVRMSSSVDSGTPHSARVSPFLHARCE